MFFKVKKKKFKVMRCQQKPTDGALDTYSRTKNVFKDTEAYSMILSFIVLFVVDK